MENQITGHGRTLELNGETVRFHCDRLLPLGQHVQLILTWPIALSERIPLNLWITGSIIGVLTSEIEVKVSRYEFRTRGVVQSQPADELPVVTA